MKATVKIIEWTMIVILPLVIWFGLAYAISQKFNFDKLFQ
jgi:hypothetical protein